MSVRELTDKAVQIIGVAGVVWYGETAVTDGHLAFAKRQREEAQLVQQTSQSLQEETRSERRTAEQTTRSPNIYSFFTVQDV